MSTRHKMESALCNKAVHLRSLPQVGYCPCALDKGHARDCRCGCEPPDSSLGGRYGRVAAHHEREAGQLEV